MAVSFLANTALGQGEPALVPPVSPSATDVPYPPDAHGDAVVLLELTIEKDGTVSQATVVEGEAPFAEHARRAVLTWVFLPARRGDVAVRARIRARVRFHLKGPEDVSPAEVVPSTRSAATPTVPGSASEKEPPSDSSDEVTVRGTRREVGETTLSAEDVRELPGAFGDPFRAIEALPGVTPVVSGFPYFYVRGAPPNNNGYFVDGVRVPILFHLGIGEGVLHPGLVDRIDFYPGAAPASYGGFAGGIIAARTREASPVFHGEANLRLVDSGALLEAPLDGGRGSALVAGRYGYPGPILGAITPSVKLGYWDYQARATWRVSEKDTLGIFTFGSHDYLGTTESRSSAIVEQLAFDAHRIDLRYDRALTGGRLRIAATLGYDTQGGAGESDHGAPATVADRSLGVRVELEHDLSTAVRLRTGLESRVDDYAFTQGAPTADQQEIPSTANPPPTNLTGSTYADVVWKVSPRVEVVPGLRASVFGSSRAGAQPGSAVRTILPAFDPRLSTRVTLTDHVAWLSTLGLAHQYPALRVGPVPALAVSVPGFPYGDGKLQTAAQVSQGVEILLPADIVMNATGFFSAWQGLTDLTSNCIQIMPAVMSVQSGGPPAPTPFVCPDNAPVRGLAYGFELLVRRPLSRRLNGLLSYTLSRSTREAHFITPSGGDAAATVASEFDRTHVVNAALGYDLGRRWAAGARFVFYTGVPYSELAGNVPVPPYNDQRTPPFFRLDIRLEKRWPLGKDGSIAFVVEGQNVTLSKETTPLGLKCQGEMTPTQGTTQCTVGSTGPITIPSLGVEAFF